MKSRSVSNTVFWFVLAPLLVALPLVPVGCRQPQSPTASPDAAAVVVEAMNRGVSLMGQYQYDEAVTAFQSALQTDPGLTDAKVNLAIALFNRNGKAPVDEPATAAAPRGQTATNDASAAPEHDVDRAARLLEEVLAAEPEHLRATYFKGILLQHVGKAEEAIVCFEHVVKQRPHDGAAWYLLGLCKERLGQSAEADLLKAIELKPYLFSAYYKLFQMAARQGQQEQAQQYLDKFKALRESPLGEAIELPQYHQMGELALTVPIGTEASPLVTRSTYRAGQSRQLLSHSRAGSQPPDASPLPAPRFAGAASGDVNSDGQPELFLVAWGDALARVPFCLKGSAGGLPFPAPTNRGLGSVQHPLSCAVGDFDNDEAPDLFVVCRDTNRLFQGSSNGIFTEVTARLGTTRSGGTTHSALWLDADHDGDLDLFVCQEGAPNQLFNNNGDGTFTNIAASAGVALPDGKSVMVLPGDLDGDRDMDLVLLRSGAPAKVFLNDLLGRFHEAGLDGVDIRGDRGGVLQEFNGDGRLDLVVLGGNPAALRLHLGDGRGRFTPGETVAESTQSAAAFGPLRGLRAADVDLDGDLDIAFFGEEGHILLNDGTGRFTLQSRIWSVSAGAELAGAELGDLTGDLVPDLLLFERGKTSRVSVVPGELNPASTALSLAPSGVRSRDKRTRSPASGYGAVVTTRAGLREQRLVFTGQSGGFNQSQLCAVFGLAGAGQADYVQILWPDGVAQVERAVPAGLQCQRIAELQRKISSCPVLFAWNGERFAFVTDFAGVGGLGYFVAPGIAAPPQIEEHVKIEPSQLRAKDGSYELRVTEPMEETAYVDRLELLAVDHPAGVAVFPEEHLAINGPAPTHELLVVEEGLFPVQAFAVTDPGSSSPSAASPDVSEPISEPRSRRGNEAEISRKSEPPHVGGYKDAAGDGGVPVDCTENLLRVDRMYAYPPPLDRRYIGFCTPHTLELDFGDRLAALRPEDRVFLFVHGFIEYPYSQTVYAASQSRIGWEPIRVEQQQADGSWATMVPDGGAPGGLARMMTINLTGKLDGGARKLRLTTNLEIFYDQVFVARHAGRDTIKVQPVPMTGAELRRVGFAKEYSPDGREPLIFDYHQSEPTAPFHVLRGAYTRFGPVMELLTAFDDRYVLLGPGEEIALTFDAATMPAVPDGMTRSFVLVSHAYCKDMDLYTATPQTLEPLPFREMSQYPYLPGEHFPDSHALRQWRDRYNTRVIE